VTTSGVSRRAGRPHHDRRQTAFGTVGGSQTAIVRRRRRLDDRGRSPLPALPLEVIPARGITPAQPRPQRFPAVQARPARRRRFRPAPLERNGARLFLALRGPLGLVHHLRELQLGNHANAVRTSTSSGSRLRLTFDPESVIFTSKRMLGASSSPVAN